MNFTPEVVAALAILRNAAENDFERHRLDVLERDLTAPPIVEIISEKRQKFNGTIYAMDSQGHYVRGASIHRDIWFYYHGEIPEGYVIHHVDKNKANNHIENLQLLTSGEHVALHTKKTPVEKTCPVCGKKFVPPRTKLNQIYCSSVCNAIRKKKPLIEKICPVCGKSFAVKHRDSKRIFCSHDCSYICKKKYTKKICPICKKEFIVNAKNKRKKTCSPSCGVKLGVLNRGDNLFTSRKCAVCGKEFLPRSRHAKVRTCSVSCGRKLAGQTKKAKRTETLADNNVKP